MHLPAEVLKARSRVIHNSRRNSGLISTCNFTCHPSQRFYYILRTSLLANRILLTNYFRSSETDSQDET